MRPVISRVRVGDVLKGTRNLRNWLQTAATLNYLNYILHCYGPNDKAKECIYTPSKNDEFLVTVNAWGIFGVYNVNKNVVLVFVNPNKALLNESSLNKHIRMDSTIFSKWFIRTNLKYPDLTTWQQYPYYMWATLHLNMGSKDHAWKRPQLSILDGPEGPFKMYRRKLGDWDKPALKELIKLNISRGITRPKTVRALGRTAQGPKLEQVSEMREDIRVLCSNPRLRRKIKATKEINYQAFHLAYLREEII